MFLKGRIKTDNDKLGLIKTILESEGIKVEEEENELFFEEEVNPLCFTRTKSYQIFEELKNSEVKEIDIFAYSIVEIYRYRFKNGEVDTHD